MKAYLSLFRLRFAVQLQYRAAVAAGFFTQFFFGFVKVMVFTAFYASTSQTQPMTLQQAITYTWLVQVMFRMIPWNGDMEVINLVRTGSVAYELSRPLNIYAYWYVRLLAIRIVPVMLGGIPTLVIALLLPGDYGMSLPVSAPAGLAFAVSMLAGLLLGCAVTNIISITALWTVAGEGMQRLLPVAVWFLSGLTIPLAFFPEWSQTVLRMLPFSGLMDTPFRFYLGSIHPSQLLPHLMVQLSWIAAIVLLGLWLLKIGTRKLVVQGG